MAMSCQKFPFFGKKKRREVGTDILIADWH